jgi:hypothetical protein
LRNFLLKVNKNSPLNAIDFFPFRNLLRRKLNCCGEIYMIQWYKRTVHKQFRISLNDILWALKIDKFWNWKKKISHRKKKNKKVDEEKLLQAKQADCVSAKAQLAPFELRKICVYWKRHPEFFPYPETIFLHAIRRWEEKRMREIRNTMRVRYIQKILILKNFCIRCRSCYFYSSICCC